MCKEELEAMQSAEKCKAHLVQNQAFLLHFEEALLLALMEQGKLTCARYEWCVIELRRQMQSRFQGKGKEDVNATGVRLL